MWAITTLLVTCCVTVSKLFYTLEAQFPLVENGVIKIALYGLYDKSG